MPDRDKKQFYIRETCQKNTVVYNNRKANGVLCYEVRMHQRLNPCDEVWYTYISGVLAHLLTFFSEKSIIVVGKID